MLFILGCSQTKEKTKTITKPDAKTLMEESIQRFTTAWNQGSASEIAKEFTADAIRVISNPSSPVIGQESIIKGFEATFAEESELNGSHIEVTITEARSVSEDIYLGAGSFKISNQENEVLEEGKWGNVYKYSNGEIKFLMESAHRKAIESAPSQEGIILEESITSEDTHYQKIEESVSSYIRNFNNKDQEGVSMLFTEDGIQNVNSKEGIVLGRQQIKETETFADEGELNATILGYQYLGDDIAIAYGKWVAKSEDGTSVFGQWGNLFKIEGEKALLIMESAGLN